LLGALLAFYGLLAIPSPLPGGIVFLALGIIMIAAANPAARPVIRRLRRRWPWFNAIVKVAGKKGPKTVRMVVDETDPAVTNKA
jgi:xanthosine utilization system XapX-like protein